MISNIVTVPDVRLKFKCEPIKKIDNDIKCLAFDMHRFLKDNEINGGLAANQVGHSIRLFIIHLDSIECTLINPEIVKMKGVCNSIEQCLSIPGELYEAKRPKVIKIRYTNLNGEIRSIKGHDILAKILHHEIEHLDGLLINSGKYVGRCEDALTRKKRIDNEKKEKVKDEAAKSGLILPDGVLGSVIKGK